MAERYIFQKNKEKRQRAGRKQIEQARGQYPKMPEHFRQMVEQAAQEGLRQTRGAERGKRSVSGKKRSPGRIFLPVAATLAIGCGALAAGNLWLKPYMTERGFTEEDAEKVLVTEPQQQVTELEHIVYPTGQVKDREWNEPLLCVEEAYFDGNSLYFAARGSEESEAYDLFLRDHGSINGYDGRTDLGKAEEESSLYLGRIELFDKSAGEEILEGDTVEVEMTVQAYPRYEGRTFLTWKDEEAYEKVYGTGAFESDYFPGTTCYILSREDYSNGYTPQQIRLQVPVTGEAREIIRRYLEEDGLTWDSLFGNLVKPETEEKEEPAESASKKEGGQEALSGTVREIKIEENHVTGQLTGENGVLPLDAEITQMADTVYTGTLEAKPVDIEIMQSLYAAGEPEGWQENEDWGWQYQDRSVRVSSNIEHAHYENEEIEKGNISNPGVAVTGKEKEFCLQIMERLGKEALIEEISVSGETASYSAQEILEGLPVVSNAISEQWATSGYMVLEKGSLALLDVSSNYFVTAKEEAQLLDMEEILESTGRYAEAGELYLEDAVQPVTEINLEYNVEMTRNGLVFRPVWTFRYSVIWTDQDGNPIDESERFFCIDAVTGALVRDTYGQ